MFTVFIVDDDELIVRQIESEVPWMDNGFEVIGTEVNSRHAVERVMELKPDVVFSDLKMPYLDGHSFMKAVREGGLDTEFVMLSAFGTFEDARTFFQQEGFDYLLKPLQVQEVQLVLEKLAARLARKHPQKTTEEVDNSAFSELIVYVKEHSSEKLSLEQLGKKFGLSAGYICNLFSKYYNTTLTRFVTKVRMERAAELISGRRYSLKEVALECGYMDYFYFNKVFKGYYGMAPSQFLQDRNE